MKWEWAEQDLVEWSMLQSSPVLHWGPQWRRKQGRVDGDGSRWAHFQQLSGKEANPLLT